MAGLLKSHPEGACNLLICENARLLEEGLGSDVSFGSTAMFTVYMASQFNVWLMLGWQSSSVFSLISSGLCLGKITWVNTGTAECFLWKASGRATAAVQPSWLTQLCPAQEPETERQ